MDLLRTDGDCADRADSHVLRLFEGAVRTLGQDVTFGTDRAVCGYFDALLTIPLGLYLVKFFKPQTDQSYFKCAATRILLVSNTMPLGIVAFYWMGGYKSMLWVAAIAAIAWYFSKPTLGKMEKEMTPEDPNVPTY